jgi:hypothetical protein
MDRLLALLVLTAFSAAACTHTVIIETDPPGGEIKVNGEVVGKGPVSYSETTGWEKVYEIEGRQNGRVGRRQVKQTEWNIPVTVGSIGGARRPAVGEATA